QTDGPAILATQKSACTINGINDKDALAIEATGIVGSLLAEPAIGRAGAQQAGCEVTVDDNIGFADGGGILLGPAFDVPAKIARGNDPRGHGTGAEQFKIVFNWGHSGRH